MPARQFLIALALVAASVQVYAMDPPAKIVRAKLGLSDVSIGQRKDIEERIRGYADLEAALQRCGRKSSIEQRLRNAVAACVATDALDEAARYFRDRVSASKFLPDASKDQIDAICHGKVMREIEAEYRSIVSNAISDARRLCSMCVTC
jgi:hypothetical protein